MNTEHPVIDMSDFKGNTGTPEYKREYARRHYHHSIKLMKERKARKQEKASNAHKRSKNGKAPLNTNKEQAPEISTVVAFTAGKIEQLIQNTASLAGCSVGTLTKGIFALLQTRQMR